MQISEGLRTEDAHAARAIGENIRLLECRTVVRSGQKLFGTQIWLVSFEIGHDEQRIPMRYVQQPTIQQTLPGA